MDYSSGPTISGTRLVVIGLAVIAVVVIATAQLGPSLRSDVMTTTAPRTVREPIAAGQSADGRVWEVVARFDGEANCAELRFDGGRLDRACDDAGTNAPVESVTLTQVPDGPIVAYGVADEGLRSVNVVLEAGTTITVPVEARELGFPVGFWATPLPRGELLHEVVPTADLSS